MKKMFWNQNYKDRSFFVAIAATFLEGASMKISQKYTKGHFSLQNVSVSNFEILN